MGEIKQPKDKKLYNGKLGISVKYNPAFADTWNERMQYVQTVIDSEALKLMAPYTPMRTGELMHSATLGTVIGSGKIVYTHPGARYLYYGEVFGPNIPIKENDHAMDDIRYFVTTLMKSNDDDDDFFALSAQR